MPELDPFQPINSEDFKPSDLPGNKPQEIVEPSDVGVDDLKLDDIEKMPEDDAESSLDDFESEISSDITQGLPDSPELPQPVDIKAEPEKQVKWTVIPTDNNEIKSQHVSGFILRAKPLSAKAGEKTKYIVQLFKDKKIIDKGVKWIDAVNNDPRTYLQNISDRVLNKLGFVSNDIEKPAPAPEELAAPEGEVPEAKPEEIVPEPESEDKDKEFNADLDKIIGST